jgi:hypothetical protein
MISSLGVMAIVELILFNIAFIFVYQPSFIFDFLSLSAEHRRKLSIFMTVTGLILICFLFCWSFYFGANIVIRKNELIRTY